MKRPFLKMHGLGNDFVVFDAREAPLSLGAGQVRALADRRTGIGCDQLIVIEPSDHADVKMRIWNSDGGEVEACGNASRCVATLLGGTARIETAGGILSAEATDGGACVDMGKPRFGWDEIPLAYAMDTGRMPVAWEELAQPCAINVGNPHLVFFVDDAGEVDLGRLGPTIATDPLFPQGINVNVASTRIGGVSVGGVRRGGIDLRVWERGAGLTRACGTGACATAVAAIRDYGMSSPVGVFLPGGMLSIEWQPGASIRMTGPATRVFDGEVDL